MHTMGKKLATLVTASVMTIASLASATPAMAAKAPNVRQIQQTIESSYGDIDWTKTRDTLSDGRLRLIGTDEQARFRIDCIISYPPLRIRCTITFFD